MTIPANQPEDKKLMHEALGKYLVFAEVAEEDGVQELVMVFSEHKVKNKQAVCFRIPLKRTKNE